MSPDSFPYTSDLFPPTVLSYPTMIRRFVPSLIVPFCACSVDMPRRPDLSFEGKSKRSESRREERGG